MSRVESQAFYYHVDPEDRITQVSPNWDAFALANDAPEVCAQKILKRPLMIYLSGLETKHLYTILLAKVRRTQEPVTVPFRCDGPSLRRFMELTMRPLAGRGIEFQSIVLREETRDPALLLDRCSQRSEGLVSICAWCKKVRVESEWLEVEDAIGKLQLFHQPLLPKLTHGMCGSCRTQLENEMAV